jgi:hypothetical protein
MIVRSDMAIQSYEEALHSVTLPPSNHFDKIVTWCKWWVKGAHGQTFTTEFLRAVYEASAHGVPAEPRVYGAVVKELLKLDLIEAVGWEESKNKQAHKRPIRVWRIK